jgi:hypothetical protein
MNPRPGEVWMADLGFAGKYRSVVMSRESFQDLIKMVESIRRGERPAFLNPHIRDVIPASGERAGPG